jgi:hypothetical protein
MCQDLQQKWNLIEQLLNNARADLPEQSPPSPEFLACLTEFEEFISHNELGLALECIADAGQLVETGGRFWHSLTQAADEMGLHEQAREFEFRFVLAAERVLAKGQNQQ